MSRDFYRATTLLRVSNAQELVLNVTIQSVSARLDQMLADYEVPEGLKQSQLSTDTFGCVRSVVKK